MRGLLLKASESRWLAEQLPRYPFARRAVRKFMPGEAVEDALDECAVMGRTGVGTVVTRLGENVTQAAEAESVARHYVDVLEDIQRRELNTHISVKLTQLGLDIDTARASAGVQMLMNKAAADPVWIDIESSRYVDSTIGVFNEARATGENVGLCVQAYLRRTSADLDALLPRTTALRLVKGAYREPAHVAFEKKSDVDANYMACAGRLLEQAKHAVVGHPPAFATHDQRIIADICALAERMGVERSRFEFQLLYGINTAEQKRLAREHYRVRVLISYGEAWFPWYMRRLAERPANVLFLLKTVFS